MTETALHALAWLLIPAGLLPIVTAIILHPFRRSESRALRDRYHLAVVLGVLGGVSAAIAIAVLTARPAGPLWPMFALALLAADLLSGKWLFDYWQGRFR